MQDLPLHYRAMGGIKDALQSKMLRDDVIRELIMPELDDDRLGLEENWEGGIYYIRQGGKQESVTLQGYCFTVPYVKETLVDDRIVICMETYLASAYTRTAKEIVLMINVFSGKTTIDALTDKDRRFLDRMHLAGYTGNRVDMTVAAICHMLDTTKELIDIKSGTQYGIGKANLQLKEGIVPYQPTAKFYGKQIFYHISDFNVTSSTPSRDTYDQAEQV